LAIGIRYSIAASEGNLRFPSDSLPECNHRGRDHGENGIIDKTILWEGSLNILSHHDSCEVMRRIESHQLTQQMLDFVNLNEFVG